MASTVFERQAYYGQILECVATTTEAIAGGIHQEVSRSVWYLA